MSGRMFRLLFSLSLGLLCAALFFTSAFGATVDDHGMITTVPTRDIGNGRVMGFVDLRNDGASDELVSVSAEFFDDDGCIDDVFAQWSTTSVTLVPGGSVRFVFRVVYVSSTAVENAHGDPEQYRDRGTLDFAYRIFVNGTIIEAEASTVDESDFRTSQVAYFLGTPLFAIAGTALFPQMDWDGDLDPSAHFVCEPTLTGTFTSVIEVDPNAVWDLDLAAELKVIYRHDTGMLASVSYLEKSGWTRQNFVANMEMNWVYLSGIADFDPTVPALHNARIQIGLNIAGATLEGGMSIGKYSSSGEPASGIWGQMAGQSPSGMSYIASLYFNVDANHYVLQTGCQVRFTSATIRMQGLGIPGCPSVNMTSTLTLTDTGFDALELDVYGLEVPTLPWIGFIAKLRYELEEKALDITLYPNFQPWEDCFQMYMSFGSSGAGLGIGSIEILELLMEGEIGGIGFMAESSLGSSISPRMRTRGFATTLGYDYWESYRIWSSQESCCGPVEFETAFYFREGGLLLFDVAAIQALFSVQVSPKFKFGSAFEFDLEATGNEWAYWDLYFKIDF